MHIRRSRTARAGSEFTYRLEHTTHLDDRRRQITILNLGGDFKLDRKHWPRLYRRIEQIISGQRELSGELPKNIESHAQLIATRLLAGESNKTPNPSNEATAIDMNSLQIWPVRSFGVENAALWAMDQLGFLELLEQLEFSASLQYTTIGTIVARLVTPDPMRSTRQWLTEKSSLGYLLGTDLETSDPLPLGDVIKSLLTHRPVIERHLFAQAMARSDLQPSGSFIYLTGIYPVSTVGDTSEHSFDDRQEQQTDCVPIALSLVFDASGFAQRFEFIPGQARNHHSIFQALIQSMSPADGLIVMDYTTATDALLQWMQTQGYRYLIVGGRYTRQLAAFETLCAETAADHGLFLEKVMSDDGREVRLYCFSEAEVNYERVLGERFAKRFEQELGVLADKLSNPRCEKRVDKIWQRIGRLRRQAKGMAKNYLIEVETDASERYATAVHFTRRPREGMVIARPDGYRLRTNATDWDDTSLWRTYFKLADMVAVFRSLQPEYGLFSIDERRTGEHEGHLLTTVIAYQLVQTIRAKLRQQGEHASWSTLRTILEGHYLTTVTARLDDGRTLRMQSVKDVEPEQQAILDALGRTPADGFNRQTIV